MIGDERIPEPQPSGALVPPPHVPSTALATAAPVPPRRWDDDDVIAAHRAALAGDPTVAEAYEALTRAARALRSETGR